MSGRSSLARVCALRRLQEEHVEAELRNEHRRRQVLVNAAEESRLQTSETARVLFAAMEAGQREYVVAAGLVRALAPLRESHIAEKLAAADALVDGAAERWQQARIDRMQVESVLEEQQRRLRYDAEVREQKSMDGWFLISRAVAREIPAAATEDESSQRLCPATIARNGTPLAESSSR